MFSFSFKDIPSTLVETALAFLAESGDLVASIFKDKSSTEKINKTIIQYSLNRHSKRYLLKNSKTSFKIGATTPSPNLHNYLLSYKESNEASEVKITLFIETLALENGQPIEGEHTQSI